MIRRYRAVVAYDGTRYNGFQRQSNAPTVQAEIEAALRSVGNQHVNILCAGRTDTGVHAHHQVIAWDFEWRHQPEDLHRAVNANLPRDIALQSLAVARADFHPRYDASSRVYQYQIYNAAVRHPFYERTAWHIARALDAAAMQQAAGHLIGEHDFAAFGRPPHPESTNTVRTVHLAKWETRGACLAFTIEANAFLQRMVRRIVGTLVQVGDGSLSPEAFADILAAADSAGPSAPPQGLSLIDVKYVE
jgi:tRNA pseudouridine38-40 synthase